MHGLRHVADVDIGQRLRVVVEIPCVQLTSWSFVVFESLVLHVVVVFSKLAFAHMFFVQVGVH